MLVRGDNKDSANGLESVITLLPHNNSSHRQQRPNQRRLQKNRFADHLRHKSPVPNHRRTFRSRNYRSEKQRQEAKLESPSSSSTTSTSAGSTSTLELKSTSSSSSNKSMACDPCIETGPLVHSPKRLRCRKLNSPFSLSSSPQSKEQTKRVVQTWSAAPPIKRMGLESQQVPPSLSMPNLGIRRIPSVLPHSSSRASARQ